MRRTEQLQGLRLMKFEEVYGRSYRGELSQVEASEILGVSESGAGRYQAEGAEGLYDRRLGRASARRAGVDEVLDVLALFDTRYWDFTAKHFWEKLVDEHGVTRSYNWLRTTLQAHGRIKPAPRRGAHRRKRPRRPVVGMMLHQDASSHAWVAGEMWDLVVTLDDATSEVYSGFFVAEEGTMSSFQALSEVIAERGLFCSLYADRAAHYWHTPKAGGKVDKDNPTQVGRALQQLGMLIAAYSRRRGGARSAGTLQKRLPPGLAGIDANRFPRRSSGGPQRALCPAAEAAGGRLCRQSHRLQEERVVAGDNTVRYKNRSLQIPADRHRHHYVKARVRVHEYPDGHLAVFHGPRCLARYTAEGEREAAPAPNRAFRSWPRRSNVGGHRNLGTHRSPHRASPFCDWPLGRRRLVDRAAGAADGREASRVAVRRRHRPPAARRGGLPRGRYRRRDPRAQEPADRDRGARNGVRTGLAEAVW